ncbi:precorrin-2 dehydrogenase/sirohydrochlorin ferrochelatase [Scopulibacillus daqui]|uniref:precorrin-2 dehydrogenase n=1 Tax=Scopulibacillus daqui TaxID=1469162 RepID=A0ABS2Q3D2_9BACL|nr:NAD(P)-binding protein [Scopulibacillus daqui]MBM7646813.1 precorrin-2 dehydrogenase/sirohydrochlorin ferrochelatase [Scopulibacillus daqui]
MSHYPINLNLTAKKTVVIGGGRVASRRIASLVQANADVTVVSPQVSQAVYPFIRNRQITWHQKVFEPEDIIDAFIVIAATNDRAVNRKIAESAGSHQLVNVASQPELGNFEFPAVLNRGRLTISVSTSGASPILARKIRDSLSKKYDETYDAYLEFLFTCRQRLKESSISLKHKNKILHELLDPKFHDPRMQEKVTAAFDSFINQYPEEPFA